MMKSTDFFVKNMPSRKLGKTQLEVSALGMGTAGIGGLYHDLPFEVAEAALHAAWDAGIRYFDSAPFYGYGKSEHRLGHVLRNWKREEFVLSTKVGRVLKSRLRNGSSVRDLHDGWGDPFPFEPVFDYSYEGIIRSFEDSQQRLGIDRIDILLIHDIGRVTHGDLHPHYWRQLQEGGFKALDELRSSGMVQAIGIGVNESEVVLEAMEEFSLDCCLLAGRYTLLEQKALDKLLPECAHRQVSVLLGGPFNSGILAQGGAIGAKYNYGDAPSDVIQRVQQLQHHCDEFNVSMAAAALQFPYIHPHISSVVMGPRSEQEVRKNIEYFQQ